MSSHLAISYAPKGAVSSTSSATTGSAASTATDSLGFLGALLDQLLASSPTATATDPTAAATDTSTVLTTAALSAATAATTTADPAEVSATDGQSEVASSGDGDARPSRGITLLKRLAQELRSIQVQLGAGEEPDSDQWQRLNATIDALSALIGFTVTTTASDNADAASEPVGSTASEDTLAAIRAGLNPKASGDAAATSATITRGLSSATASTDDAASSDDTTATTTISASTALASLKQSLETVSVLATSRSPELAQKLEAFATQLGAAQSSAQLATTLAGSADDPAAAITTALAPLSKPIHMFSSEMAPLMRLAGDTQLQLPTGSSSSDAETTSADTVSTITRARQSALAALSADTTKITVETKSRASTQTDAKPDDTARLTAAVMADADPAPAAKSDSATQTAQAATASVSNTVPAARTLPAAYQPVANPINMGQVAFELVHQVRQGQSRFSIRLDPPELGRIDVRMSVDQTGTMSARLTVDRSETLDLFQRDRGTLEKALAQAGLDAGKTNLEFSLRQNPFAGMTGGGNGNQNSSGGYSTPRFATSDTEEASAALPSVTLYRGTASAAGINILV